MLEEVSQTDNAPAAPAEEDRGGSDSDDDVDDDDDSEPEDPDLAADEDNTVAQVQTEVVKHA